MPQSRRWNCRNPGSSQRRWQGSSSGQRLSKPHTPPRKPAAASQPSVIRQQTLNTPPPLTPQLRACCWPCSSPGVAPADLLLSAKPSCSRPAPCYGPGFTPSLLQTSLGSPSPSCPSSRQISAWAVSFGPFLHHRTSYQLLSPVLTLSISSQ